MTERKCFVFRFADVEVREREFLVTKAGQPLAIEPKAFRVLQFLLHHPQKLVTKDELLDAVWKDVAVTENSPARAIAQLRRVLGDNIHESRFIATITTAGYRFVCPVEAIDDSGSSVDVETRPASVTDEATPSPTTAPIPGSVPAATSERRSRRKWAILAGAGSIAFIVAGFWYTHLPLPPPRITDYSRLTLDGRKKLPVGSDGIRLYLNLADPPAEIAQVAVSGGQISPVPIPPPYFHLADVSPDGSSLLVSGNTDENGTADFMVVGAQGSPSRYLTQACDAKWSNDGKSVIYSTCHGDIYQISSEGGESRLLVASPAPAGEELGTGDQQLSPDGRTIRFDRDHTIWEMSADGANLHQFLPDWRPNTFKCCGHWTPDGEFFLFTSGNTSQEGPNFTPGAKLWASDERRGRLRPAIAQPIPLTSGPTVWDTPIPSRDGQKIFVRGVNLRGEVVRYDNKSRELEPYLDGLSAEFLSFSKDGQWVAYVSFPDGILWRANRDGSGPVQLTKAAFRPKSIRWSPDGTQIIFTDDSPTSVETIYVVSSHGDTPVRLLPEDNQPQQDAFWSPDGKRVAYASAAQFSSGPYSSPEIRILDLASHSVTTLPGSEGKVSPRWSPDGRHILALNYDVDLQVYDFGTQHWTSLRKGKVDFPSWSHDSRFIYFVGLFERGVFRVPVSGGRAERIVDLKDFRHTGWFTFWMGLDPDDAPLLLRDRGTDEIYALTLERK
jgi:Tol biopolymer transport system component/DNA-binding winged helix-turn-helix (wHTH) protein